MFSVLYRYDIGIICKCKSLNPNSFITDGNQQVTVRLKVKVSSSEV
jgi:hypothetical protein